MTRLSLPKFLRRGQVDDLLQLEGQRRAAVCAGGSARPGLGVSLIGQFGCGTVVFWGCLLCTKSSSARLPIGKAAIDYQDAFQAQRVANCVIGQLL